MCVEGVSVWWWLAHVPQPWRTRGAKSRAKKGGAHFSSKRRGKKRRQEGEVGSAGGGTSFFFFFFFFFFFLKCNFFERTRSTQTKCV